MPKNRNFLRRFAKCADIPLFLLCLTASIYGLVLIYSAALGYNNSTYMRVQTAALCIGIFLYFAFSFVDTDVFSALRLPLFVFQLLFLATPYFWGASEGGNRGWLRFGAVGIQPAEAGKLLFILTFSAALSRAKEKGMRFRDVCALFAHAVLTMGFVVLFSRDDGMTLAYGAVAFSMAFYAGVPAVYFLVPSVLGAAALPFVWDRLLAPYQRNRILAVFSPEDYPNEAYQALHSRAAIRAGGLFGEGYMKGTQTQYGLIPTKHTDSIFPVAGEELGLVGAAAVIFLLVFIIWRVISHIKHTETPFYRFILVGIAAMLSFQTILNLGMNLGVFPVVGLTLPFFSYGGSSLVTVFACAGAASGIRRQNILSENKNFKYIRRYR